MGNTLKQSTTNLKKLTGKTEPEQQEATGAEASPKKGRAKGEVMIAANFPRVVRRSLAQLQTLPANDGKTIKDLLAEALNDLFAKYGLPETAHVGRGEREE